MWAHHRIRDARKSLSGVVNRTLIAGKCGSRNTTDCRRQEQAQMIPTAISKPAANAMTIDSATAATVFIGRAAC
jgi:hypothetical protein